MRQGFIRYGQFLFKYRSAVFPLITVIILALLQPQLPYGSLTADHWMDALGVLIIIAGLALRALVIGLQYIQRGGRNKEVYANTLVTGGIFAASRNPLYVGNCLLLLGLLVICGNPWGILIGMALAISGYHAIVAAEETFLLDKFGDDYRHYCRTVNRWMPSPPRVLGALSESRFNWPRVVIKDYNTDYLWLTAALAVLVYEHLHIAAYQQNWSDQLPLALTFIGLTIAYLAARLLKKKQLLTANGWQLRART